MIMMTTEELQQLAFLIEKAKTMLTTPSGEAPSMVYFEEGKLVGVTHWGCAPTEDYFRLVVEVQKEQKVKN